LTGLVMRQHLMPLSYILEEVNYLINYRAVDNNDPKQMHIDVGCGQPSHTCRMKIIAAVQSCRRDQFEDYGTERECSHRCHWDMCIHMVHVDLKPRSVNQDRKSCRKEAENMLRNGTRIPKHCSDVKHGVSCLM
jgi:hypothetical protein